MTTIIMQHTDQDRARLEAMARRYGLTVQQIIAVVGTNIATEVDEVFERASDEIMEKNAELYHRLA